MDKERAGIQSVEVGFLLLEGLTRSRGPLMLKDLAASAGMSAAKAHRYLVSFQRLGLVVQDSRTARYDLGPAALRLGLSALSRIDGVRLARERLPALMEEIGHTLALAVWGNHGPTIVHWEPSPQAVTATLRLGDVMPLLSSATGRCFTAYLPPEMTAALLQREIAQAEKMPRTDVPTSEAAVQALVQVALDGADGGAKFSRQLVFVDVLALVQTGNDARQTLCEFFAFGIGSRCSDKGVVGHGQGPSITRGRSVAYCKNGVRQGVPHAE